MTERSNEHATRVDSGDDPADLRDPERDRGMPRWVKILGIVALLVIVAAVVIMAVGSGNHGPGRHMPSGERGTTPTSAGTGDMPPGMDR